MSHRQYAAAYLFSFLIFFISVVGYCADEKTSFYATAGSRYETGRFRVAAQEAGVHNLKQYGDMCEETLSALAPDFDPRWPGQEKIEVRVCTKPREFTEATDLPSHTTMAVALPEEGQIILNGEPLLTVAPEERFRTVGHEMVHLLLGRIGAGEVRVPAWLHEGLAQTVTAENGQSAQIRLAWAYIRNTLIPINDLRDNFPYGKSSAELAYAESASFTRFMATKQFLFPTPTDLFRYMLARPAKAREIVVWLDYPPNIAPLEVEWRHESAGARNWFYIITSGTVGWTLIVLLFLAAYVRKRLRARRVMENWDPWEREDDPWEQQAKDAWEEEHSPRRKDKE